MTTEQRTELVTHLLNGTITSIKNVIPMNLQFTKPKALQKTLRLDFGVLIGITGDIQGKLVFSGNQGVFGTIGENMFGMALEGEMLASFSGELGNMIAGGITTNISNDGYKTDITSPTIMEGNTTLSGYEKAIEVPILLENAGELVIYLLLN